MIRKQEKNILLRSPINCPLNPTNIYPLYYFSWSNLPLMKFINFIFYVQVEFWVQIFPVTYNTMSYISKIHYDFH
jgi:hypothetical protein